MLLLGWVILANTSLFAQFYPIKTYDETSGIPSSSVFSVHQDRSGLMWFATRAGISSYDGKEWNTTPLPSGYPSVLSSISRWDERDLLWTVAIDRPQLIHHFDGERWVTFDGPPSTGQQVNVEAFDVSRKRGVPRIAMLMSDQTLVYFESECWVRVSLPEPGNSLRFHESQLLVGTVSGLYALRPDGRETAFPRESLLNDEIKALASDPAGFVWVLGSSSIMQWREGRAQSYYAPFKLPPDAHPNRLTLTPDGVGGLFVTHWYGIVHVDSRTGEIPLTRENGLASNGASSLYVDHEGNAWIANPRGLSKLTSFRFAGYQRQHGLLQDEVSAIVERRSGEIVIGHPYGLTFFGPPHKTLRFLPDDRLTRVIDLAETPDGRLWAAANHLGIAEIADSTSVQWRKDVPGDPRSVEVDRDGRLWVASSEGLFTMVDDRFLPYELPAVDITFRKLIASPRGGIFGATPDKGLALIRDGEIRQWRGPSEAANNVYAAIELPDGTVLAGTAAGLHRADGTQLLPAAPEVSRPVYFLNRDRSGKLWIGTDNGVMRWDGKRLDHFTAADGLIGRETNRAASLVDRRGHVWSGTETGVTVFRPELDHSKPRAPFVEMLAASAEGRELDFAADTQLSQSTDDLHFRFSVRSFVDESRVRIRSWLEGYEDDWSPAIVTGERELHYRGLKSGKYRLRLQAAAPGGPWSEIVSGGSLTVKAPFWKRAWFVVVASLLLIGMVLATQRAWAQRRYALRLEREVDERLSERRLIEDELGRARRLESLGVLAGGIAHDFNNLMTIIMGNLSLLKVDPAVDSDGRTRVSNAEAALLRARDLTMQLMTFSRGGAPVKSAAGIAEIVHESAGFVLSGTSVRAEFDLPEDLWPVEIDAGQMNQVITNLMLNSIEAMSEGGQVSVRARNLPQAPPTLPPGRYIELILSDSGHGIPSDSLDKVFDPYFSTKERGSGLGLAMAYSIVNRHEGKLTAESDEGSGTTFRMFLPATELPERHLDDVASEAVVAGSGRVLVMDDEAAVCEVIASLLRDRGYEVECTSDGEEAIERLGQALEQGRRFDLAILDLTVPGGLGGKETIKRLRELDPELKAIVVSGYSNDPVMANFDSYGFDGCVRKPFQLDELARTVSQVASSRAV